MEFLRTVISTKYNPVGMITEGESRIEVELSQIAVSAEDDDEDGALIRLWMEKDDRYDWVQQILTTDEAKYLVAILQQNIRMAERWVSQNK